MERVGVGIDFVGGGAAHRSCWLEGRDEMGSGKEN